MPDVAWGGLMTLLGMGTVFALLALLFGLLTLLGRLDRPAPAVVDADAPRGVPSVTIPDAAGLDDATLAAIAVAVIKHAEVHRRQAAPETRTSAPGSQLFASRWVAIGRGFQNSPFTRR